MKIYIDGIFHSREEARVSVFDHGFLYGDGVFEGIRVYGGKVFKLREHVKRLEESARALLIDLPMSKKELEEAVLLTVRENGITDGYIRLVLTRGVGSLGLDPASCKIPSVVIIADELQLYPEEFYERGIKIITASTRRMPSDALEPRIKSLNYLNNILARAEAARAGCLEAVMLNTQGYVAECTADNIFVVKDERLLTPPPSQGALDGITMRTVLELATGTGIRNDFSPLTRFDLYTADECFVTGTGAEIVPVVNIDGRSVGTGVPGPITGRIRRSFEELVRGGTGENA